jgi:hypothetical protein
MVTLRNGIPVHEWLNQGQWEYFTFTTFERGLDISLVLTAITGNSHAQSFFFLLCLSDNS